MAVDPNSSLGQIDTINTNLAKYFKDISTYVSDDTQPYPDLATYLTPAEYTELHRYVIDNQSGSSSYSNGAAIENIHHITAITREYGLRTKSKNQYYQDGQAAAQLESEFYEMLKQHYTGMFQGIM